jgi:hypothetical protein
VDDCRDALRVGERRPGLGVDVDPQLVGVLDVRAPRGPGMEVDDGEVRSPRDLRQLGHAELVGVPSRREGDADRLHPVWPLLGHPLLVDLLALDPVGEATELRRPVAQRPDDPVADGEVVVDEVPLRVPGRGEEHLVGVADADGASADLQLDRRPGHPGTVQPAEPTSRPSDARPRASPSPYGPGVRGPTSVRVRPTRSPRPGHFTK